MIRFRLGRHIMPSIIFRRSLLGPARYVFKVPVPPEEPVPLAEGDAVSVMLDGDLMALFWSSLPPSSRITKISIDVRSTYIDVRRTYAPPAYIFERPTIDTLSKICSMGALMLRLERDRDNETSLFASVVEGSWGKGRPFWSIKLGRQVQIKLNKASSLLDLLHVIPLIK